LLERWRGLNAAAKTRDCRGWTRLRLPKFSIAQGLCAGFPRRPRGADGSAICGVIGSRAEAIGVHIRAGSDHAEAISGATYG
jgi:hypothetical protein